VQKAQPCVRACPGDCIVSDWSAWGPCHWPCESQLTFGTVPVITARRCACAVYAVVVCPSVRLSVRLSQAGCVSNNTQTMAHDSPGTLVSGGILKMLTEYYFEIRYFYSD